MPKGLPRNQIIEGRLIHFPAFVGNGATGVAGLGDIVEMLLPIEASVERQQPSMFQQ